MKKAREVIRIREELCVGCGLCVNDCIRESLSLQEGKAAAGGGECNACGHCYAICPTGAVVYADGREIPQPEGALPAAEDLEWLMKNRRSVRHFLPQPVPREDLEKILDVGRYAPTARNAQNVTFRIFTDALPELEREIDEALLRRQGEQPQGEVIREGYMFRGAPCAILICSKTPVNAAVAAAYMELYAEAMGYGTVYVGRLITALRQIPGLRERMGLSVEEEPVACLVMGKAAVCYHRVPERESVKIFPKTIKSVESIDNSDHVRVLS